MKSKKVIVAVIIIALSSQFLAATLALRSLNVSNSENVLENEYFLEIEIEALPEPIKKVIQKEYKESKINKVYVDKEGIYKLKLKNKKEYSLVYFNAKGKWLEV